MRAPKGYKVEVVVPGMIIARVVRNDIQRTVGVYAEGSVEPHVVSIPPGHCMMDTEIHSPAEDLQNGRVLISVPKHASYGIMSHSDIDVVLPKMPLQAAM